MVARTAAMQRGRTGRRFLLYSLALSSAALARPGLPRRALQFASLPGKDAAANSTAGCRDAQAECAGWASRGECDANPAFMLTSCADSCTRCAEGPHGVGKPRSLAEMQARRDTFCGNIDGDEACEVRRAAGHCNSGTDAPLRCAAACRICRWPAVAQDAYGCDRFGRLSRMLSMDGCEAKRRRCARPPDTPALVGPGGVSATMERLLRDFPQYEPRAVSRPSPGDSKPWVVTLQNFLSAAEVDAFIDGCSRHFARSLAGDELSPVRTSSQCWCEGNACAASPRTQAVAHRIADLLRVHHERYFEPFQILRYEPGQFYKVALPPAAVGDERRAVLLARRFQAPPIMRVQTLTGAYVPPRGDQVHHDQNSGRFTPQGARVYTFFMYLSTPEAGGGTRFADLNVTVPARKGSAVLWPSVSDADPDEDEPMTNHEGLPPESGVKFASNVWVHMYDFKTPAKHGCPMSFKNTH